MTRHDWTDEQLSAFMDGELTPAEMDALAKDIESDPQLAARVERLGAANTAFVDAAAQIDHTPVGAGLKALMEAPPAADVVQFRPRSVRTFLVEHRAIAASLLCAVAVWGVTSVGSGRAQSDPLGTSPDGLILASSSIGRMLETAPTGELVTVAANTSATPRLTFTSAEGGFCRQFDVTQGDSASAAIACREESGWRTQIVAYGLPKPTGDFQTASASRSPALEAYLDQHMTNDPLNADAEAKLLREGWKRL